MKLARLLTQDGPDFALSTDAVEWVPLRALGAQIESTAGVIGAWPDLVLRFGEARMSVRVEPSQLLCPIVQPPKVIAIGLNYLDHANETSTTLPSAPMVFTKFVNSLHAPTGSIDVDRRLTNKLDYEVELGAVLKGPVRGLPEATALDCVFGYVVANDVTARDLQLQDALPQFSLSKSLDTFGPVGPWITTADEVPDPQALKIACRVNGETRQEASTADMIFSVAHLVAYLSTCMTLDDGDLLLTGTPSGVAMGMASPEYLEHGDVVECELERLGTLVHTVKELGRDGYQADK